MTKFSKYKLYYKVNFNFQLKKVKKGVTLMLFSETSMEAKQISLCCCKA